MQRISHSVFQKNSSERLTIKLLFHVDSTRMCMKNTRMLVVETIKCYLLHVNVII